MTAHDRPGPDDPPPAREPDPKGRPAFWEQLRRLRGQAARGSKDALDRWERYLRTGRAPGE